ncbi:ChaN family lipoprotein [Sorangium sp. So ce1078]|uniref:ChaN family lipoprotein n=1 Tax=Sorangium sp. So ce1078 TaxID=3133329 RepID=UPI003F5E837E
MSETKEMRSLHAAPGSQLPCARRFVGVACAAMLVACSASPPARAPAAPSGSAPAKASPADAQPWQSALDRDHALVGKLWDVKAGAFVEVAALAPRLASARFVLLGERHDNRDHHRLQARVLEQVAAGGRRPRVVFEMLEAQQQPAIEGYVATRRGAADFGAWVGWEKTSWPPYAEYQPIFDVAFRLGLPIVGGNVAQEEARALARRGLEGVPPERAAALRLQEPLPAAEQQSLEQELRDAHCGHLPERFIPTMALAQRARDAQLAQAMARAEAGGAVLVAGAGHVRRDRGVPYWLSFEAPGAEVLSLSFLQVQRGVEAPGEYAAQFSTATLPFDFVWFTPRVSDEDPCAAFRAR